jgi:hypothetical protein
MATEEELKEIIRKKRGGRWIEYHGPYKIGAAEVWEIWTWTSESEDKDDWTPQTRFWLEEENGSKLYFNYFSDLASHLSKQTEEFKLKRIALYVASFAFIAAVCAMIIWLFTGKGENALIIAALTGLITTGAAYYMKTTPPAQH